MRWSRGALGRVPRFRPTAGNLVLLADTGLVCKPDFYLVAIDLLFARDRIQARGAVFFKILDHTLGDWGWCTIRNSVSCDPA